MFVPVFRAVVFHSGMPWQGSGTVILPAMSESCTNSLWRREERGARVLLFSLAAEPVLLAMRRGISCNKMILLD